MKKLLSLAIIALMLCSCADRNTMSDTDNIDTGTNVSHTDISDADVSSARDGDIVEALEDIRLCSADINLNLNGELYVEVVEVIGGTASRLNFVDFDTMLSTAVCSKPNCKHNDYNSCSAFGYSVHPTIIGSKLYAFESGSKYNKSNRLVDSTTVWETDLDSSNRAKLDEFELFVSDNSTVAVIGYVMYFIGIEREYNDYANTGFEKYYLCGYDFKKKEFKNHGKICEGYSGGGTILGEYNGSLYISASCETEKRDFFDFTNATDEEINQYFKNLHENNKNNITVNLRFELSSQELLPLDMPSMDKGGFAYRGMYGYVNESDKLEIVDIEGESRVYDNFAYIGGCPINGMIFNLNDMTALDISSGEVMNLNSELVPQYGYAVTYHDNSYIFIPLERIPRNYVKVSENDIIVK